MSDMECFSLDSLTRFLLSSASTWLSTHTHTTKQVGKEEVGRRKKVQGNAARDCWWTSGTWVSLTGQEPTLVEHTTLVPAGSLKYTHQLQNDQRCQFLFSRSLFFFWFFLTFLFGHLLLKSVVHSFSFCWWWCQYNGRHYCDTPSPFVPATSLTLSIHLQTVTRIKSVRKVK